MTPRLTASVRARFLQGFFRTRSGEYGEGDRLLGLTVPDSRKIARAFRGLALEQLEKLIASRFHEHRLIALLILVDKHQRGSSQDKAAFHCFYLRQLAFVNSWDLVDTSAAALVGEHIKDDPGLLKRLATSANVWERRIAMVSTFAELRAGRTKLTFKVAAMLLDDLHDLIHKATGWLLHQAGKLSQEEMLTFLRRHYAQLPRTTLRYAIERLDPMDRKLWLRGPQ